MDGIINDFLASYLNSAFDNLNIGTLQAIARQIFYFENFVSNIIKNNAFVTVYQFTYILLTSVLAIKVVQKGFYVYILYRDGDADVSPKEMIVSIVLSMSTAGAFPYIYEKCTDFVMWATNKVCALMFLSNPDIDIIDILRLVLKSSYNIGFLLLLLIIYLICIIVFWFKALQRSVEMFILRMFYPLSCIGLIDSDGGLCKSTTKLIIQNILTVIIQVICFNLSLLLILNQNILFAIGAILAAINGPTLMQSLLVNTGGGNGMYKIQSAVSLGSSVAGLMRGR